MRVCLSSGRRRCNFAGVNSRSCLAGFPLPLVFLAAAFVASTASAQLVAVESDVVVPGILGLPRRVDSQTLILSGASQVVRRQENRERQAAEREARRRSSETLQQMQEERKQAEKEAVKEAGTPIPMNAGAVEASMTEGTNNAADDSATSTESSAEPSSAESSGASLESQPEAP